MYAEILLWFFIGGEVMTMTSDSKYLLGIMVSAATEKWQLKIEGGRGSKDLFLIN